MRSVILSITVICSIFLLQSCKGKDKKSSKSSELVVHMLSDADMILPYNSTSADATYQEQLVFQKLIDLNYETGEFTGIIAKDRPTITPITDGPFKGGMKIEYEIRPEAKWDNGSPITGYDVLFSFKCVLNPQTNNENIKPYYDWLGNAVVDSLNPKKITMYSKEKYILVEEYSGYWVLPEYIYDSAKIMRGFNILDMNTSDKRTALKGNPDIQRFADNFNSEKFQREKGFVVGSGPYQLDKWITGQRTDFVRKTQWWGDSLNPKPYGFEAFPTKIIHKVINDWNTASTAIKKGDIDCTKGIEYKIFTEFSKSDKVKETLKLETPSSNHYLYIGLNLSNPKLKDIKMREALAHIINRSQIINTLVYGLAEPVESMVHPTKDYYNKNLKPFEYNPEMSNKLLDEAGWKDTDEDGFRDKKINGITTKLSLEYKYNSGNETRKNIGLMLKEEAKKVGIELNIVAKEFNVFLQDLDKHDFEVYCGAWVGDPTPEDPKQIWHTSSAVLGGSNYVSYGDKESDKMIEEIRSEIDDKKRNAIYLKFQEKVHRELPYIFLYAPKERMAFSKRFITKAYSARPGYVLREWKIAQ